MSRGKSNSFGVPHERQDDDPAPTEDELVEYGEDTWEVGYLLGIWTLYTELTFSSQS